LYLRHPKACQYDRSEAGPSSSAVFAALTLASSGFLDEVAAVADQ
jgi:hypothetical protein